MRSDMRIKNLSCFFQRKLESILLVMIVLLIFLCFIIQKRLQINNITCIAKDPYLTFDNSKVINDLDMYLESVRAPNGLTRSFTDTSSYVFAQESGKFYISHYGRIGYLEEQAFTYDLSLAVIGYLLLGHSGRAEKILDLLEEDFYLPKNGETGLYNSYSVSSNIPYNELLLGSDGDRIHAGPMLWVAFASLNHMQIEKSTRYLDFVLDMVNWCRNGLTYYRFPDGGRGGISMGFGWGPDWDKIFSTEHNIDYYAVLKMLHAIYQEYPETHTIFEKKNIDKKCLKEEMKCVGRFLREVSFDKENYCFIAGVNPYGIDKTKILDGTTWGIAGVGPEVYASWGIDVDRLIESTEKIFYSRYNMPDGTYVEGMDITDFEGTGKKRSALVWWEGTGQHIIALGEMVRYYYEKGNREKAILYKKKAIKYMNDMYRFSYFFDLKGALPYMVIRPEEDQIVKTMQWEWELPRGRNNKWVKSMSSGMWFLYALKDLHNPMKWEENRGKGKNE